MIKRLLPKTLFARALLIVALPIVLVQIVSAYIFYERHWDNITRHMADTLAGEIAFFAHSVADVAPNKREELSALFSNTTGIDVLFMPGAMLAGESSAEPFPEFTRSLQRKLGYPFRAATSDNGEIVTVDVALPGGLLQLNTSIKRLQSGTTTIFLLWMTGSSVVFLCIAIVFLRNQVRPIRKLAEAAEQFGKGRDMPDFKPSGAMEVRRAARAFLVMRERIQRQIRSRTEMLAGVSHDLRTPLTRMKLQLSMLGNAGEIAEMQGDVAQMEHMIEEYLDFARGDGGEEPARVSLAQTLQAIADDYARIGQQVALSVPRDTELELRPHAFRRMLHNLIDNALRYGARCAVEARVLGNKVELLVDDAGPGIPQAQREEVFRPFHRLDASRNLNKGGVGLGLTIARDIARAHGGNIALSDAPTGGLRVCVHLPI
jgi:two-component system osmolarity sensor histidine kinase EnvZ